jgi:ankyrin repeat protein
VGKAGGETTRHEAGCAIVRLCARFDDEREATARVLGALLGTTTSAQACKNKALRLAAAAAAHENPYMLTLAGRLIAGGAEVDAARRGDGYTPLLLACSFGNVVMVERLIAAGSRVDNVSTAGGTPLYLAARKNRLDVVRLLIAAGADVNMAGVDGFTPLHISAHFGHADVVDLVIAAGADVNAARTDGTTALSTALAYRHAEVVQKLRAAGAN